MKKIIVFWDNKGFDAILKGKNEFIVCSSQSEFNSLSKNTLKEARGFLVLCELNWNHEKASVSRTEFGGIRLVQRFIRNTMNLKTPVVFASFDSSKNICDLNSENRIVKTPALKHFFVNLPASPEELSNLFDGLENMSDTELAYTKLLYCDIKGLIVQINHVLEGRSKTEQDKYRKDIEYVLKEQFHNDEELMEQYRKTKDLSDFCKTLLDRFNTTGGVQQIYDGFLHEKNHKTIRILLLEDELEKDENVDRFVKYIKEMEQKAEETRDNPLFRISTVKNMDDVAFNKMSGRKRYYMNDFDVIICDIEILNEKKELITLGFNVVEAMAKESKRPLYYIVTNVSRSFYDQIKIPCVRRIRLKNEVFGTRESIETFLYGVKEVFDNREAESAEKEYKCEVLFNTLFDFVKGDPKAYNVVEDGVKEKSMDLIKHFLSLFVEHPFRYKTGEGGYDNFIRFDENCKRMREYIKTTIGLGNGNLDKKIAKREKNNQDPTDEDIANFVVRLVLRRLFLYVKCYIDHYNLMSSFENYKNSERLKESNRKKVFSEYDIACRAISDQYKTMVGEYENEKAKPQSHCLDETLLYAIREPMHLTFEEEAFVKALDCGKKVFPEAKSSITKLKIEY